MATATAYCDADCGLREIQPDTNFDGGVLGTEYSGMETKELEADVCLRFDFSAEVGAGDTINSATIQFYVTYITYNKDANKPENFTWYVRRCLQSWVVDEATFNIYSTGNGWNSGGARTSGTDYTPTDQGTASGPSTVDAWWSVTVTDLVKDAHDNRSQIFDVVLHGPTSLVSEGDASWFKFVCYGSGASSPKLVIDYTAAAAGGSRNRGYVFGSKLGLPSLPDGWLRRRGLLVPAGA